MPERKSQFKSFLILVLMILNLVNCSHQQLTSNRTLATETSQSESLESQFLKILRSKTSDQLRIRLQLRLNEIEELYFRAHSYRKKFDLELDHTIQNKESTLDTFHQSIIDSSIYPHLIILKEKLTQRNREMIDLIERLLEVAYDSSDTKFTQNERVYARKSIDYISTYYHYLPFQFLIAHYSIAIGLEEKKISDFNLRSSLDRILFGQDRKMDPTQDKKILTPYSNVSIRKKIEENIAPLDSKTTYLSQKINDQAQALQEELKSINFWDQNIDSLDWQDHDPKTIVTRILNQIELSKKRGGMILFHENHPQSIEAARQITEYLSIENKNQPDKFKLLNFKENR